MLRAGNQHPNMGRKSNMSAHNNWGSAVKVLTSVNNAPWCAVRKSLFYPPIELHGNVGSTWRVIKSVPLVTDFMGRLCIKSKFLEEKAHTSMFIYI
jgi:hypothetical protein